MNLSRPGPREADPGDTEAGLDSIRDSTTLPVEDTGELIDVPPGEVEFARLPTLPPGTESVAVDVVIRVRKQGS